jgi:hypothetical protein
VRPLVRSPVLGISNHGCESKFSRYSFNNPRVLLPFRVSFNFVFVTMAPSATDKLYTSSVSPEDSVCYAKKTGNASLAARFAPYRQLVPVTSQPGLVYLNSSYAPPSNLIIHEAITAYSHEALHDPHPKPQWQAAAEELRGLVAKYVNTEPSNIAFTRNTTEALGNFVGSLPLGPDDNIVVLDTEHPNHVYGWMALRRKGVEVRQVPTIDEAEKTGQVVAATAETFAPFVDDRTKAIGLSSIMFHSGQRTMSRAPVLPSGQRASTCFSMRPSKSVSPPSTCRLWGCLRLLSAFTRA